MELARGLTVCICTRDRPRSLARALESVATNAPDAQIIVSDDGETPVTAAAERIPRCSWQRGPQRGLGANRNAVVDVVRTPWILFLDDDARLGEEFLPAVEERLAELPEGTRARTIVTGRELNNGRLIPPHDVDFLGFQRRDYGSGEPLQTVVINAAVWPTMLFDQVRFDESLLYGSDEVDLSYSALAVGYRIEACPGAVNYHDPDPQGRQSYAENAQVSRLRATTKRYWRLQRRRGKAIVYLIIAPPHLAVSMLKREGIRGLGRSARIFRRWLFA